MTSEPSQPEGLLPMELPSMSSSGASHARTLARREGEPELVVPVLLYGRRSLGYVATLDLGSLSWKTSQRSFGEGWTPFSPTLPRSGMMQSGIVSELTPWQPVSVESAFGFWHTPTTRDYKGQSGAGNRKRRGRGGRLHIANLCDQLWDTGRLDLVRSATFREWLMGLPIGHTDLKPSETP